MELTQMSEIIDIAKFSKRKKKTKKFETAEDVTRDGVASLLHYMTITFQ